MRYVHQCEGANTRFEFMWTVSVAALAVKTHVNMDSGHQKIKANQTLCLHHLPPPSANKGYHVKMEMLNSTGNCLGTGPIHVKAHRRTFFFCHIARLTAASRCMFLALDLMRVPC